MASAQAGLAMTRMVWRPFDQMSSEEGFTRRSHDASTTLSAGDQPRLTGIAGVTRDAARTETDLLRTHPQARSPARRNAARIGDTENLAGRAAKHRCIDDRAGKQVRLADEAAL